MRFGPAGRIGSVSGMAGAWSGALPSAPAGDGSGVVSMVACSAGTLSVGLAGFNSFSINLFSRLPERYFDQPLLAAGGAWHVDLDKAVLVAQRCPLGINLGRKANAALELAAGDLQLTVAVLGGTGAAAFFAANGETVPVDLELNLLPANAGNLHDDDDLAFGLIDVDGRLDHRGVETRLVKIAANELRPHP